MMNEVASPRCDRVDRSKAVAVLPYHIHAIEEHYDNARCALHLCGRHGRVRSSAA